MKKAKQVVLETPDSKSEQEALQSKIVAPPQILEEMPNPEALLDDAVRAPKIAHDLNIFPIEWRVETPRLMDIYEQARDPGWSPSSLKWDEFDVDALSWDQRYAIAYWWGLLSVFDASGPAVFARAMIHA
ncbi:MAG TPA: hypothetical protein V6C72_03995, partial [Chroococcales cyanobacterium]